MRVLLAGWAPADAETSAAEEWLAGHGFAWRRADAATVGTDDLRWSDVVWCHAADVPREQLSPDLCVRVSKEGGVLLTLAACRLPFLCGMEPLSPRESRGVWSDENDPLWDASFHDWPDYPHIRGLQGWAAGSHPLFEGFQRGTFTRSFEDGDSYVEAGYDWPAWPPDGARVIAVERAYVQLNARRVVAWEYAVGGRRVLCLGAHVSLIAPRASLRAQRDRVLGNALALAGRRTPPAATEAVWPSRSQTAAGHSTAPVTIPPLTGQASTGLSVVSTAEPDAPFTLAGRRALVIGTERDGVRDVWLHPLCAVSGGLRLTVDGVPVETRRVQLSPTEVRRALHSTGRAVSERIVPAIDEAYVLIAYESEGVDAPFEIRFEVPLRLEWPFDADALWPLAVTVNAGGEEPLHSIAIVASDGQHAALIAIDGADAVECNMSSGVPSVRIRRERGASLRILITADSLGIDALRSLVAERLSEGALTSAARERHFASLRQRTIRSATPDEELDVALSWAMHRLDMFVARTPDGGTGLMAGYAASGDGWNVSRPGYAWFFGRDACWCADAMLAAGMFEDVREIIRHLAETRDVTGKVIHELTTSGVAHYDAADSTPLFLRLVAAYHEWTGDNETVRDVWGAAREALQFVASTDRDGDGIPENTGVGHGWIESGPLGGGAVTSYVASIWIDALRRLRRVADAVEDESVATACQALLARASRNFDRLLRDKANRRVVLQLQSDGTPQTDVTALSAVPIALGVDQDPSADRVLADLTAPPFSAPWGVRMLPTSDPRYNPRGYHSGAVWPLFTGWTSLACFERGHSADGIRLLQANAKLWTQRAKGAFDEVLDGDTGAAAGICPDQAWSAAMVVAPVVHGLWGVQPNAYARVVRLGLQLPGEWTEAVLEGLRVGHASLDVRVERATTEWGTVDDISIHVRDGEGALDTVIVEVLAAAGDGLEMKATPGSLVAATTRECRPGWNWHGMAISVRSGEAHLTARRRARP